MQLLISPNEVELSSVPPEIAIAGSLEILKDPEIWICDTGASNHLTFAKVGWLAERPSKTQSQGISGQARKAGSEIDLPNIVCGCFGNELIRVTLKAVSYEGDSNFTLSSFWQISNQWLEAQQRRGSRSIIQEWSWDEVRYCYLNKEGCVIVLFDQAKPRVQDSSNSDLRR